MDFWIAFITGLTTGGLSCMVVQGGLITGTLARQVESDMAARSKAGGRKPPRLALPIVLFLAAKLLAYTLLGFLLGLLGSAFSLSPVMRGVLQLVIAVFMIGNALRLLNVHPIFRYFNFEPPSAVTRMIRRRSKQAGDFVTPLSLGALTVLIPCGITQTMLAAAVASASPMQGAVILFAFVLGTSPVFFALTYLATRLSALVEKQFFRIVALALIVLAVVMIDQGLNLVGSPVTLRQIPQAVMGWRGGASSVPEGAPDEPLTPDLRLVVHDQGYYPETLYAPAGEPLRLHLLSKNVRSCSLEFTIPARNISILLPSTGEEVIDLPAMPAGQKLHFSCSMGMYVGDIVAVEAKASQP